MTFYKLAFYVFMFLVLPTDKYACTTIWAELVVQFSCIA